MSAGETDNALPATRGFSRRDFLKSSGGLVIGFSLFGAMPAALAGEAAGQGAGDVAPPPSDSLYAWLAVHPDNTVTLFTGKVEVGNGVQTALGQIAAEELYFPVQDMKVVMGTTSVTVDQGPTYGSRTIRYAGPQIRHAAAAGRQALLEMAAKRFDVPADQLHTEDGVISVVGHPDRSITYGDLVDGERLDMHVDTSGERFDMKVAPDVDTKDASTYSVVGQSVARTDIPGKVTGEFTYIQDVKVDGMLHGRVVRPYGVDAHLEHVDESGLSDIPGFVKLVRRKDFLGVVAETEWGAITAARRLGSKLHPSGPDDGQARWSSWNGLPKMENIWQTVRDTAGSNTSVASKGSVDMAVDQAARTVKATYRTPFQMHGAIGPSCAVADVRKDGATLWAGTQMPHQARRDMARLLNLPLENVELRWFEAAGAYGRNGAEHVIGDAALMSAAVGKPVRVQWMRWDEHAWEPKGPPIAQDLVGAIDEDGNVTAWRHHMWIPTFLDNHLVPAKLIGRDDLGRTGHGLPAITYAYKFANADVACHGEGRVGLLTAWLRSPAQFETTFAMEAFADELAAATKEDPLSFRLRHLDDPRAIAVLKAASRSYGWRSRPSPGESDNGGGTASGRGIAWVNRDGTCVGMVVDLVVHRDSGEIRVKRVAVAQDCGLVVNPDGMRNQIEGNVVQSLSRTLHEEVTFSQARVTSRDWKGYPILRFEEIPDRIDITFVNNRPEYDPNGGGEPSTCPTAAAVSNAVFDATGVRLRETPFRAERVKAALKQSI